MLLIGSISKLLETLLERRTREEEVKTLNLILKETQWFWRLNQKQECLRKITKKQIEQENNSQLLASYFR